MPTCLFLACLCLSQERQTVRSTAGPKKKKEAVTHSIKFPSGSLQYTLLNLPTAPVRSTTFEPSRIYKLKSNLPLADDSHKINQQIGNSLVPHLNPSSLPSGQNLLNRSLRDEAQIATSRLNAFCLGFEFLARQMEIDLLGAEFEGMSKQTMFSYVGFELQEKDMPLFFMFFSCLSGFHSYRSTPSPALKVSCCIPKCVV